MKYEFFDPQSSDPCKVIFHHNDFHLVPMHFHAAIEVNYVFSGREDWVTVNGQRYRPQAGDTLVINSNVPHAFTPAGDRQAYDSLTLIYPYQRLMALYPPLAHHVFALRPTQSTVRTADSQLQAAFTQMRAVHDHQPDRLLGRLQMRALGYAILSTLLQAPVLQAGQPRQLTTADSQLLAQCITDLNCNLAAPLDNSTIAAQHHISVSKLTHLFHTEMGQSVQTYIRQQRLAQAYDLLMTQHKPVGVIADLVGFPNEKAFITAFRSIYHVTPFRYRHQMSR
ncbi:AraC family transcriptional regulator [Levilactobacillus zymae]|uniref:Transcriptional regulator, AraC family n=1 Tax=Levilactobacillus zymae TaxID=267363 RepID=A0A1Y6JZ92_9LACO|nr:AraC family transcriptional regulator [Levilactobacillus zymae]SMS14422.1 Transcriptional regulator, AraC family [Levilactobacillus zymae]